MQQSKFGLPVTATGCTRKSNIAICLPHIEAYFVGRQLDRAIPVVGVILVIRRTVHVVDHLISSGNIVVV